MIRVGLACVIGIAGAWLAWHLPPKLLPGFDEPFYLGLASSGWLSVISGETGIYHATKALPFLVFRALFGGVIGDDAGYAQIAPWMLAFNALCLVVASAFVARILIQRGLSDLAGPAVALLVVSKAFLGFYVHYPLLGDVFTLALGSALTFAVMSRHRPLLFAVLAASAVASSPLCLFALIVIALPPPADGVPQPAGAGPRYRLAVFAMLVALPLLAALAAMYVVPERTVGLAEWWGNPKYLKHPLVVAISLLFAAAALWMATAAAREYALPQLIRSVRWRNLALAALLLSSVAALTGMALGAARPSIGVPPGIDSLLIKASYLISRPGPPGIPSHLLFYGLAVAAAIINWKLFCAWLARQGAGVAVGFSVMLAYFGLDGEVRHVIFLLPLVVVGVVEICAARIRALGLGRLMLASSLLALGWIPFMYADAGYRGERHLSAFGMCWSNPHYLVAVVLAGAVLFLAWRWLRVAQPPTGATSAAATAD